MRKFRNLGLSVTGMKEELLTRVHNIISKISKFNKEQEAVTA